MPRAFAVRKKCALLAEFQNHLTRAARAQLPRDSGRIGQCNVVAGGANDG